jgi:hypothetical protein
MTGLAQQPKRPDGPSQSAHGGPAQHAVTTLGTGAMARLPTSGTATRWVAMVVESTNGARPPCRARWLVAELTDEARQCEGRLDQHGGGPSTAMMLR